MLLKRCGQSAVRGSVKRLIRSTNRHISLGMLRKYRAIGYFFKGSNRFEGQGVFLPPSL